MVYVTGLSMLQSLDKLAGFFIAWICDAGETFREEFRRLLMENDNEFNEKSLL